MKSLKSSLQEEKSANIFLKSRVASLEKCLASTTTSKTGEIETLLSNIAELQTLNQELSIKMSTLLEEREDADMEIRELHCSLKVTMEECQSLKNEINEVVFKVQ